MNVNEVEAKIEKFKKIVAQSAVDDVYNRGMYNGMEFALTILCGYQPIYMEMDGTLDKQAVENSPERFL